MEEWMKALKYLEYEVLVLLDWQMLNIRLKLFFFLKVFIEDRHKMSASAQESL